MAFLLQIDIHNGPGQTKRETFTQDAVVFGRDAAAQIVIVEKTASRKHGEIKIVDGKWSLINHSPNGTVVNGREVTSKPQPIKEKDRVSIGGTLVFEIIKAVVEVDAQEPVAQTQPGKSDGRPKPKDPEIAAREAALQKQRRLLLFGGIYAAGLLALIIFFVTLGPSGDNAKSLLYPRQITKEEITKTVRQPLKLSTTPDLRTAQTELKKANTNFERLDNLPPKALYETYLAYKIALANFDSKEFDVAQDRLRFDTVQTRLADKLDEYYQSAYEKMKAGQFIKADDNAQMITTYLFPEFATDLYKNVGAIRRLCAEQIKKKNASNR
jgi:pSer/pThr/pTyr-binding forkhead associated (FHA) protein